MSVLVLRPYLYSKRPVWESAERSTYLLEYTRENGRVKVRETVWHLEEHSFRKEKGSGRSFKPLCPWFEAETGVVELKKLF